MISIGMLEIRAIRRQFRLLLACGFAILVANTAAAEEAKTTALQVKAVEASGTPAAGVKATVYRWDGEYRQLAEATTDAAGLAEFDDLPVDESLHVHAYAAGYAHVKHSVADGAESVRITMAPAAEAWVEVRSPDGRPVEGAEFSRLSYTDRDGKETFIDFGVAQTLGIAMPASDAAGRLPLPAIPAGVVVTANVFHPEWKATQFRDAQTRDGLLTSIELEAGVPVELQFRGSEEDLAAIEGRRVEIMMLAIDHSSRDPETLWHHVEVRGGRSRVTLPPIEYSELRFYDDRFSIGPLYYNYPRSANSQLDFENEEPRTLPADLYRKRTVRGRVVDEAGEPVAGVYLSGRIKARNYPAGITDETTVKEDRYAEAKRHVHTGSAQTDAHGVYEIELAAGAARIDFSKDGMYAIPNFITAEVPESGDFALPEFIMHPTPTLGGQVVDATGNPIGGAVVLMVYGSRRPWHGWAVCDGGGRFELKVDELPEAADDRSRFLDSVQLAAFDPHSDRGGRIDVAFADRDSHDSLRIAVEPKPRDWLIELTAEAQEGYSLNAEELEPVLKKLQERYPLSLPGQAPPDIVTGTWLNTDARKLSDFRGKHVLLDFWFVGCGPCEVEMPRNKAVRDAFAGLGLELVGVHCSRQISPDEVQKFADEHGMDYPIVVDGDDKKIYELSKVYGVGGFPTYMLLGPDGRVVESEFGRAGALSMRGNLFELVYYHLRNAEAGE